MTVRQRSGSRSDRQSGQRTPHPTEVLFENLGELRERAGDQASALSRGLRMRGEHLSSKGGSSTEFADYRDYHPGDDFRRIDYHLLARLDAEGCARYVVTDVNKDGMLQGPNLDLLRDVCAATDRPVVASGGITELADLEALQGLVPDGVEGAIIGTALYEGRFTLEDALALTKPGSGAAS